MHTLIALALVSQFCVGDCADAMHAWREKHRPGKRLAIIKPNAVEFSPASIPTSAICPARSNTASRIALRWDRTPACFVTLPARARDAGMDDAWLAILVVVGLNALVLPIVFMAMRR